MRGKSLGLFFNECGVVEIVDLHGAAHVVERGCCYGAGIGAALLQHVVDGGNVLRKFLAALADRFEEFLHDIGEETLHLHVAQTAALVVCLEFVEVGIVGQIALKVLGAAEGIEIGEHRVAFEVPGVTYVDMRRVGIHRHDALLHRVGIVGEIDAVAEALRHLRLAVSARQAEAGGVGGQEDFRLDERFAVDIVEAAHDFRGLLDHRFLVLAGGHGGGAEGGDVGGLADGVGEEAHGNRRLETAHLYFGLHGGVALQAAHAHEVHEVERKFAELGDLALYEERDALGVEAAGEVVECHLNHVLPHLLGVVDIVGECLGIGDKHKHLFISALVLQGHAVAERADVVPDVQAARWAVARKDYFRSCHLIIYCLKKFQLQNYRMFL